MQPGYHHTNLKICMVFLSQITYLRENILYSWLRENRFMARGNPRVNPRGRATRAPRIQRFSRYHAYSGVRAQQPQIYRGTKFSTAVPLSGYHGTKFSTCRAIFELPRHT